MAFPVQTQRFARLLQKKLGIQGFIGLSALEDVAPMVGLITGEGPEDFFLREEHRHANVTFSPAVAAAYSFVNYAMLPGAQPTIAVLERLVASFAAATTVVITASPALVGAGGVLAVVRDSRLAAPGSMNARARLQVTAGSQGPGFPALGVWVLEQAATVAGQHVDLLPPGHGLVIAPGGSYDVFYGTQNVTFNVSAWWREYTAAPQELTSG